MTEMSILKAISSRKSGQENENLALKFLQNKGLLLVSRNYHTRHGEIDLIMKDRSQLVFLEVRFRLKEDFGSPLETVNQAKQQKIIRTSKIFLHSRGLTERVSCRFDVIGIIEKEGSKQIYWIRNAFY